MATDHISHLLSFDAQSKKRISYILTTKNRADRLAEVLPLIGDVMTPEDELIVIDGGSTDHTAEVIGRFKDIVNVFVSEPDMNAGHASNKGILFANGKYIKQLADDDNLAFQEGIEKMYGIMEEHPEIDVLVGGGVWQGKNKKQTAFWLPPGTNYGSKPEDVFLYGACGGGLMVRRSVFAKIGLFSPHFLAGDFEFLIRCFAKGVVVKFCRINVFSHTVYDWSMSTQKKREANAEKIMLARQYCSTKFFLGFYVKKSPLTRRTYLMARRFLRMVFDRRQREKEFPVVWDGGFS